MSTSSRLLFILLDLFVRFLKKKKSGEGDLTFAQNLYEPPINPVCIRTEKCEKNTFINEVGVLI